MVHENFDEVVEQYYRNNIVVLLFEGNHPKETVDKNNLQIGLKISKKRIHTIMNKKRFKLCHY